LAISIIELKKALDTLQESLNLYRKSETNSPEQKAFRDASIQRFEYLIELSWKISMKFLGSQTSAAKPAIREMARNDLIDNPELWLLFIDARNASSHSYDEDVAKQVFEKASQLPDQIKILLKKIENK